LSQQSELGTASGPRRCSFSRRVERGVLLNMYQAEALSGE
jgi:hypothetical protein